MNKPTIFHSDDWIKITKKHFGRNVKSFFFDGDKGKFNLNYFSRKKLFFRSILSPVPGSFAAYGGPLYHNKEDLSLILSAIDSCNYSLVRFILPPFSDIDIFIKFGYERRILETILIDLTLGKEALWSGIERSRRKRINKASRTLKIIDDPRGEHISLYIDLLSVTLPKKFFQYVISHKDFFIDVVDFNGF